MLKRYKVGGFVLQYEEGRQPKGAVEVKDAPKAKQGAARNKGRAAQNK